MPKRNCDNKGCRAEYSYRQSDFDRGWARCCSKSCAAIVSNKKTGKYEKFKKSEQKNDYNDDFDYDPSDSMYWDNKEFR